MQASFSLGFMAVEFKSSTVEGLCPDSHELLPLTYLLVVYATKMVKNHAVSQGQGKQEEEEAIVNLGVLILQHSKAIKLHHKKECKLYLIGPI